MEKIQVELNTVDNPDMENAQHEPCKFITLSFLQKDNSFINDILCSINCFLISYKFFKI